MSYIGNEPIVSATRTVTEITATAGQTTFTANSGYTVGYVDVFVNGAQLQLTDFTATDGSTITLNEAATVNDDVRIVAWGTFGVASLDGSNLVNASVTPAKLSQPFTAGTSVASTSGTSIDFTGIPSWVKRITVMFSGVSTNGTSNYLIQLGDSGGIETTGYVSSGNRASTATVLATSTAGVVINVATAASTLHGNAIISKLDGNLWAVSVMGGLGDGAVVLSGGSKTLSDTLTQIRITTVNGTDTFDAGTINILYEG